MGLRRLAVGQTTQVRCVPRHVNKLFHQRSFHPAPAYDNQFALQIADGFSCNILTLIRIGFIEHETATGCLQDFGTRIDDVCFVRVEGQTENEWIARNGSRNTVECVVRNRNTAGLERHAVACIVNSQLLIF